MFAKKAGRIKNRGKTFQNRGKGQKIGAGLEKVGATSDETGAGVLKIGATVFQTGAPLAEIGASGFQSGAVALENGERGFEFGAVVVKRGATVDMVGRYLSARRVVLASGSGETLVCLQCPHT